MRKVLPILLLILGAMVLVTSYLTAHLGAQARAALESVRPQTNVNSPQPRHLAMVMASESNHQHEAFVEAARQYAERNNALIQTFSHRSDDTAGLAQTMQALLDARLDGILLWPDSADHGVAWVRAARNRGVPALSIGEPGTDLPLDFRGQAAAATKVLLANLGSRLRLAILLPRAWIDTTGDLTQSGSILVQGVHDTLRQAPGSRVSLAVPVSPENFAAESAVLAILDQAPAINAILAPSPELAEGAVQVLLELGRSQDLLVVGFGGGPTMENLVARDLVVASVVPDLGGLAFQAVQTILAGSGPTAPVSDHHLPGHSVLENEDP